MYLKGHLPRSSPSTTRQEAYMYPDVFSDTESNYGWHEMGRTSDTLISNNAGLAGNFSVSKPYLNGGPTNSAIATMQSFPRANHMDGQMMVVDSPHQSFEMNQPYDSKVYPVSDTMDREPQIFAPQPSYRSSVPQIGQTVAFHQDNRNYTMSSTKPCPLLGDEIEASPTGQYKSHAPNLDVDELSPIDECPQTQEESELQRSIYEMYGRLPVSGHGYYQTGAIISPPLSRRSSAESSSRSATMQQPRRSDTTSTTKTQSYLSSVQSTSQPSSTALASSDSVDDDQDDATKAKTDVGANASRLRARRAHSLIERRYRENLNLRITQLHETLQQARFGPASPTHVTSPSRTSPLASVSQSSNATTGNDKIRKSDILTSAMAYIHHAEAEMQRLKNEVEVLRGNR